MPGLETQTVVALAVGCNSALFATDDDKLYYIHNQHKSYNS